MCRTSVAILRLPSGAPDPILESNVRVVRRESKDGYDLLWLSADGVPLAAFYDHLRRYEEQSTNAPCEP
jgi:hypothetical protein